MAEDSQEQSTVTLSVKGILDFQDEMEGIVEVAQETAPDAQIIVEDPKRMEKGRYGVIWGEVLNVTLQYFAPYLGAKIADAIIQRVHDGWVERKADNANPRPRFVNVYGPNGEVIRRVAIRAPDGEPTDE
jgi:hypothetical protein